MTQDTCETCRFWGARQQDGTAPCNKPDLPPGIAMETIWFWHCDQHEPAQPKTPEGK